MTYALSIGLGVCLILVMSINAQRVPYHQDTTSIQIPVAEAAPSTQDRNALVNYSPPARIKIPSLKIDASVEEVGLTKSGAMGTPKEPLNAGWFKLGPYPGAKGSAVIAGHVDGKHGAKAVFTELSKINIGDTVLVQDTTGQLVPFVVRQKRIYKADVDATEVFSSANGTHLNLITCIGSWNKSKNSYTDRLVVFTDKVE